MNLKKVTGKPFTVTCIKCGKQSSTGDEVKDALGREETEIFYADLDGIPFRAYYCQGCVKEVKNDRIFRGFSSQTTG